ncbi:response regulator transcription factor [Neptuniibacter sp.]|uniref:response regulator transcription factor n=1 Tax=Neptuniibacter sp. TaxID=1962643 RepID=UPI003B59F2F8
MTLPDQNTVFIIDDDDGFRESVHWLLQAENISTCGYSSARTFLETYNNETGCILLDVRMPDINGLAALKLIREKNINMPVIMISGHSDIPIAVRAMKQGAQDFIEKPFDDEHLIRVINQCLCQAGEISEYESQLAIVKRHFESLSRREKEVMQLVVSGLSNKEVAETLEISPKTVEVHRSRVMRKMDCDNLAILVKKSATLSN